MNKVSEQQATAAEQVLTAEQATATEQVLTAQQAKATAAEQNYIPTMAVHKKYRSSLYDKHDTTYADKLANIYYISHNQETKEKFNSFSEFLMDEPAINRNYLLDAIDDYNKTPDSLEFPLSCYFTDAAFNFRPYQMW